MDLAKCFLQLNKISHPTTVVEFVKKHTKYSGPYKTSMRTRYSHTTPQVVQEILPFLNELQSIDGTSTGKQKAIISKKNVIRLL